MPGLLAVALLVGQGITGFDQTPVKARQYVTYVAESETVRAGRPVELELRFEVRDGFHVNSHTPFFRTADGYGGCGWRRRPG